MRWLRALLSLGLVALLVSAAGPLAARIHRERADAGGDERLYYPDGALLRHASLGFHAPAADYAWLQATQYYGGYRRGEHDLRYFRGLVDAVTTHDPRFGEAYHFASLVLSLDHADFEGALDVLRRGVLANPDDWRLHFDIGFVNYVFLRRYATASLWFQAAARLPGSSDFCRRFAAFSANRAGNVEGALVLWENLRRTTDSDDMRALAGKMVEQCRETLAGEPPPNFIGPPAPPSKESS
jgi:tetratricopeptide (TPR) repeat protein